MVFVFSTVFKAILTRLIFASHAMVAIFWVTLVTKQESLWHLSWILVGLFVETLVCLFYRHGDEYKWVSPSILCYLIAIIPCAWIIELHLLPVRSANVGNGTATPPTQVSSILPGVDGEVLTDLIEQTTLLMMILGRWLLPKGSLTRESLSQLLLVNLAMSADIIEFFDILKLKEAQQSHDVTLAILCLWTISLMQFPVNATAKLGSEEANNSSPSLGQPLAVPPFQTPRKLSVPNYIQRHGRKTSRVSVDLSIKQAPLSDRKLSIIAPNQRRPSQLYTEDLETGDVLAYLPATSERARNQSHRMSLATDRIRFPDVEPRGVKPRMSVDVGSLKTNQIPRRTSRDLTSISRNSESDVGGFLKGNPRRSRAHGRAMSLDIDDEAGTEETAPKHRVTMDLIGTVMALFMQDGPFLTFRLFMIAKYSAFGYMIVFLTVKNALLLTLQVYKLCVMHCVCWDHKDNDFSPENHVDATSRLNNVQIAVVHEETEASSSGDRNSRRMRSRYDRLSVRWTKTNANIQGPLFYSRAFTNNKALEKDTRF
ncbi:uncharacterized protein LOC5511699 [Nematostella vectensis]|uniref:uncharacterized protein LOC5511699 n=1 Tax=Nematostella vectensis TaxID=45351 RepID=UPI00207796E0|nr:uncharacterized protein LOC5511699 [Nematostella vectensis]